MRLTASVSSFWFLVSRKNRKEDPIGSFFLIIAKWDIGICTQKAGLSGVITRLRNPL